MKRTAEDIYATARAAGLNTAQAIIATAIALAESGGDDASVGDVNLQTSQWGPSVGLWQVRTLKAETGSGSDRDITALQGNPARQARAMFNISERGTNWSPWTVFTRGTYTKFMGQASGAISGGTPINGVSPAGLTTTPVNYADDVVSSAVEKSKELLTKMSFAALGLGLVGLGLVLAFQPQIQKAVGTATKTVTDKVDNAAKVLL